MNEREAVGPRRCGEVGGSVDDGVVVNFHGSDGGVGASLGKHQRNHACASAYVENVRATGGKCAEQVAVGAHFHGGISLVDGELLKFKKIFSAHKGCGSLSRKVTTFPDKLRIFVEVNNQ